MTIIQTREIQEICTPLVSMGIEMFCYHRFFRDGSEIMVSNNSAWASHYYENSYLLGPSKFDYKKSSLFSVRIWPFPEEAIQIVDNCRKICNVFHGISLFLYDEDYLEGFGFGIKSADSLGLSSLLNKLEQIENFCRYFRSTASSLIENCNTQGLIIAKQEETFAAGDYLLTLHNNETNSRGKSVITSNLNNELFSKRELDCIYELILGKSATEIADALCISKRTIETHIENIKHKIGCQKKSHLIRKLLAMGYKAF